MCLLLQITVNHNSPEQIFRGHTFYPPPLNGDACHEPMNIPISFLYISIMLWFEEICFCTGVYGESGHAVAEGMRHKQVDVICCIRSSHCATIHTLFLQLRQKNNFVAFWKLCKKELDGVLMHIFRVCVIYNATRKHYRSQGSQLEPRFLAATANCRATIETTESSLKTSSATPIVSSAVEILLLESLSDQMSLQRYHWPPF